MRTIQTRLILPIAAAFAVAGVAPAFAQSSGRLEVAVQTTMLRQSRFDATTASIGGRVSFDLARWIAAEGEFNFFPSDVIRLTSTYSGDTMTVSHFRHRSDVVFGIKAGVRGERFGVFGKVRPGLTKLTDEGLRCDGPMCILALFARPEYQKEFALDTGGVFELYPVARSVVRFDVGDLMIQHRSLAAPPCSKCTTHNVTTRIGVGWRF
jgi:hypothetical protein